MDVSALDFAQNPRDLLDLAIRGETIVVVENGHPIAELRRAPVVDHGDEAVLLELAKDGFLTPPIKARRSTAPTLRLPGVSIGQTIVDDRKDRF